MEEITPENANAEMENENDESSKLRRQLDEERKLSAQYKEGWQRSQADFVNFKRRSEQERTDRAKFSTTDLLRKFLPVLDDFERALASVPEEQRKASWVEGIFLIQRKLNQIMQSEGVTLIEALGQPFDPNLHEAIIQDEDGGNQVVAVLQPGYLLHGRVLRPTMVKVGRAKVDGQADQNNAQEGSANVQ